MVETLFQSVGRACAGMSLCCGQAGESESELGIYGFVETGFLLMWR